MARRCPVCKEVLLTLRVGDHQRCDTCEHFVDPDGEVVELREGRIRNALSAAGDEPRTVAELERMLDSPYSDELKELCERHRDRVRRQIHELAMPKGIEIERVEPTPGAYREAPVVGVVRVTFDKPTPGPSETARRVAEVVMVIAGFVMLVSSCVAVTWPSDQSGAMTVFFVGLMVIVVGVFFSSSSGRPVRQLALEDGRDELEAHLVGRTGERVVRLGVGVHRIGHVFKSEDAGNCTYLRFQGPDIDALVSIVRGDRDTGRAAVIRLEDALRLSGPAPAEKKS